jgi:hypothetical protein
MAGEAVIGRRKTHISSQIRHELYQQPNTRKPKTHADAF